MGASGSYKTEKLTATVSTGYRFDPQHATDTDRRQAFDPLGALTSTSDQLNVHQGSLHLWFLNAGVDYTLDPKTQLSVEGHYNDFFYSSGSVTRLTVFDAGGALDEDFDRDGLVTNDRTGAGAGATFRHSFAGDDHSFVMTLSHDRTLYDQSQRFTDITLTPPLPDAFDRLDQENVETVTDLKADYTRPMPWQAKLKAGYELTLDDFTDNNAGFLEAPSPTSPFDPSQSDQYHARRQIDALYATWEQPLGKLDLLAGVRGETTHVDLDDAPAHLSDRSNGFRLYPSLHLSWRIDDAQQLSASYSQRVERVILEQLDPFVFVDGATSAYSGNPNLRDQETQVFEAGYQYKAGGAYYLATLYYKDNQHQTTAVSILEPDGVLLSASESLGHSTQAGLELVANGHITPAISYNISANYYRTAFDASALGFPGDRSGETLSGRGSLNWQAGPNDLFQISARASGKQITPQGYSELGPLVTLGYRRKISDKLARFVTEQDAIDTYRRTGIVDSPGFRDITHDRGRTMAAFIGFSYAFGGGTKKDPNFDYNN